MAPPPWADEDQLTFLNLWLSDFMGRQGEGKLHLFWPPLHDAWFRRWPENAALGLPLPDDLATLGAAIQVKKGKLENWFRNQRKKIGSATAPMGSAFKGGALLRKMFKMNAPKRRRTHQPIELFQKQYPNLIAAVLKEAGYNELVDKAERMRVRMRVVRALWDEVSPEVVSEIEVAVDREKDEIREEELREEMADTTQPKKLSPRDLQDGIDSLESVYTQVHKATYHATGWVGMTILGGPNPRMGGELSLKMQVRFWHSPFLCFGETPAGHDFEESCVDFDKSVWDPFEDFLRASFTSQERAERALPVRGVSSGEPSLHRDISAETAPPPKKKRSKKKKKIAKPAVSAGWRPDALLTPPPGPVLSAAPVLATVLAATPPLPTPASSAEDVISANDYDSFACDNDLLHDTLPNSLADFDDVFFADSFDMNAPTLPASALNLWPVDMDPTSSAYASATMECGSISMGGMDSWAASTPTLSSSPTAPSSPIAPSSPAAASSSPSPSVLTAAAAERPRPRPTFRGAASAAETTRPMSLTKIGGFLFPTPTPAATPPTPFPKQSVLFDTFTPRVTLPATPATPVSSTGTILPGKTPGFVSRTARAMAAIIAEPVIPAVGNTDGEPIEHAWVALAPSVSGQTREMGPGQRQSMLDDHTRTAPPVLTASITPITPVVNKSAQVLPGSRPHVRMPAKSPVNVADSIVVPDVGVGEEAPNDTSGYLKPDLIRVLVPNRVWALAGSPGWVQTTYMGATIIYGCTHQPVTSHLHGCTHMLWGPACFFDSGSPIGPKRWPVGGSSCWLSQYTLSGMYGMPLQSPSCTATLPQVEDGAGAQDLDLPSDDEDENLETGSQDSELLQDEDIVKAEDAASAVLRVGANTFATLRGGAGPFANSLRGGNPFANPLRDTANPFAGPKTNNPFHARPKANPIAASPTRLLDLRQLQKGGAAPKPLPSRAEFAKSKGYSVMQGGGFPPTSPPTSPLASPLGGHATRSDEDDDGEASDTSSYSNTAAKQLKEDARYNGFAGTLMPVIVSEEQQDEEDLEEYMTDMGRGKGKGNSKAKQTVESGEENDDKEPEGAGDDEDNDQRGAGDDDDEDGAGESLQPWDLKLGKLSDIDLKAARAVRQVYHDALEVVARRSGKRLSAIFKAVGDHTTNHRQMNPWNAFGMKYRKDHPKPTGMSKKNYATELKAAYQDLFSSLSEDEVNDPDARRRCVEPVMEWYNNQIATVVDTRKAEGRGKALLNKVVLPFIHLSTITSNSQDIEVWGFAIDPFGDAAVIWGGTPAFAAVNTTYNQAIKAKLVDMKAMFQMVNIAKQQAEANALVQPIPIDFSRKASELNARDARHRQIGQLLLNEIHLVLGERNEDASTLKKMLCQWADWAFGYKLRIENWPKALEATFPSVSFSLSNIKGKHMKESPIEKTAKIVSWTEEELALEDLRDQAEIPIVSSVDGAALLTVDKSKKYLSAVKKSYTANEQKKKPSGTKKRRKIDEEEDEEDEEDEDKGDAPGDDVVPPNTQARPSGSAAPANVQAGSSRKRSLAEDDADTTEAHPAKCQQLQAAPPAAPTAPGIIRCHCYVSAKQQFEFYATGTRTYHGIAQTHQRVTQMYAEHMNTWVTMAPGMEVIPVDEGVYRTMLLAMGFN
ncbi:hypothetical protein C8R44DRAFT_751398 [Mycena epipterygia]|nr:hypothetical protein C8R44DRAFT_751398 [Mycena epipterygia]